MGVQLQSQLYKNKTVVYIASLQYSYPILPIYLVFIFPAPFVNIALYFYERAIFF